MTNTLFNFCRLLQLTDFMKKCLHVARSTTGVSREIFLPRELHPAMGKLAEGKIHTNYLHVGLRYRFVLRYCLLPLWGVDAHLI